MSGKAGMDQEQARVDLNIRWDRISQELVPRKSHLDTRQSSLSSDQALTRLSREGVGITSGVFSIL